MNLIKKHLLKFIFLGISFLIISSCITQNTDNPPDIRSNLKLIQKTEPPPPILKDKTPSPIKKETIEKNKPSKQIQNSDNLIIKEALNKNNPDHCMTINDTEKRVYCINRVSLNIATKKQNSELCQDLSSKELQEDCQNKINNKKAHELNDITYCNKITVKNFKQDCITQFNLRMALETKDLKLCQTLSTPLKDKCKTKVKELQKKDLLINVRKGLLNASACEALVNNTEKQSCIDTANYKTSLKDKNLNLCRQINTEKLKNKCLKSLILSLALEQRNPKLCLEITDNTIKTRCETTTQNTIDKETYNEIKISKEKTKCNLIKNEALQESCQNL